MIGLDTNVLLRFLLRDNEEQYDRAVRSLQKILPDEEAFVSSVVIQEAVWVMLKVSALPKTAVIQALDELADQDDLIIPQRDALKRALAAWAEGPAGFADYFIAELNIEEGCRTTLTFDAKAAKHSAFTLIP